MSTNGYESPATVDSPLEYFTVATYDWPTQSRPKRSRLDDAERRRRRNACQKRFLARKQRDLVQLRHEVVKMELQLQLITATQETTRLQMEQTHLQMQQSEASGFPPMAWNVSDGLSELIVEDIEDKPLEAFIESLEELVVDDGFV